MLHVAASVDSLDLGCIHSDSPPLLSVEMTLDSPDSSLLSNELEFKAAGVLPFAFCQSMPCVLLGAELKKTGPGGKLYRTMCEYC